VSSLDLTPHPSYEEGPVTVLLDRELEARPARTSDAARTDSPASSRRNRSPRGDAGSSPARAVQIPAAD
jgi:hypothetical protein